jgi:hypothetical protein
MMKQFADKLHQDLHQFLLSLEPRRLSVHDSVGTDYPHVSDKQQIGII